MQGVQLPAGEYVVSETNQSFLTISGNGRMLSFVRRPQLESPNHSAHMTFNKYGNFYFLSQLWEMGQNGSPVPVSRQEKEVLQAVRGVQNATQQVVLASR